VFRKQTYEKTATASCDAKGLFARYGILMALVGGFGALFGAEESLLMAGGANGT